MNAIPKTDAVSPVTVEEAQEYLKLPEPDPTLVGLLVAATEALVTHLRVDIGTREWVLHVRGGYPRGRSISPHGGTSTVRVELPYTALQAVDRVEVNGQATLGYVSDLDSSPAAILIPGYHSGPVRVEYTAGLDPVPTAITQAIMLITAYLYEHRGMCDMADAVRASGAANLVKRYRVEML